MMEKTTAVATKEEKKFELVTAADGMTEEELAEFQDELADLDDTRNINARRIKISGITYEIETDNPDDPDVKKEIEAVIIFTHRLNSRWPEEGTTADPNAPLLPVCSSIDSKTGHPFDEPGKNINCDTCPFNQWGTAVDTKTGERLRGKACKNGRRLYMMLPGDSHIYLLMVPPTSIKLVNDQIGRAMGDGSTPYTKLIMRFRLEKVTKGNQEYSKIKIEKAGVLDPETAAKVSAMRKDVKEQYKSIAIIADDYEVEATTTAAPAQAQAQAPITGTPNEDGFITIPEGIDKELPFS